MIKNPICEAMNWPVPGPTESLIVMLKGRPVATLTARDDASHVYEGLYLTNRDGVQFGPCLSIVSESTDVRGALAQKFRTRCDTLGTFTTEIAPRGW